MTVIVTFRTNGVGNALIETSGFGNSRTNSALDANRLKYPTRPHLRKSHTGCGGTGHDSKWCFDVNMKRLLFLIAGFAFGTAAHTQNVVSAWWAHQVSDTRIFAFQEFL